MKKVRSFLATIALIATLGGLSLTGMGAGTLAHATAHASSVHAVSVVGQGTSSLAYKPYGQCPGGGTNDC